MDLKLDASSVVFFDTAPFIYYFEDHPDYGQKVDYLIESIYRKGCSFITSFITYLELITKPKQLKREDLVAKYRDFFTNSESLSLYPLNLMVSEKAADLRVLYGFKTPDAIQIATALICGVDLIVTNDTEWKTLHEIRVLTLNDL